jgi:cyd operon protein YbgT
MWYFAWLLGLPLAAAFAVLNAMWYELMEDAAAARAQAASVKSSAQRK